MAKEKTIQVQETSITVFSVQDNDYFSLTDIARRFNPESPADIIANWFRNKDTIEFLGTWEILNNDNFKLLEFEEFKKEAGSNRFTLSPSKWAEKTNAIGIKTKSGRYGGGTYAHKDISLAFCYWLSPTFQLFVIREFQRLKAIEAEEQKLTLEWNLKRTLAKVNYRIHTDAVKEHLVPPRIYNTKAEGLYFANEADLLNMALFGITASQWRQANSEAKGNMRDYATAEQLLVLANLENLNAEFIKQGLPQEERLTRLNEIAIHQVELLISTNVLKSIRSDSDEEKT